MFNLIFIIAHINSHFLDYNMYFDFESIDEPLNFAKKAADALRVLRY